MRDRDKREHECERWPLPVGRDGDGSRAAGLPSARPYVRLRCEQACCRISPPSGSALFYVVLAAQTRLQRHIHHKSVPSLRSTTHGHTHTTTVDTRSCRWRTRSTRAPLHAPRRMQPRAQSLQRRRRRTGPRAPCPHAHSLTLFGRSAFVDRVYSRSHARRAWRKPVEGPRPSHTWRRDLLTCTCTCACA